MKASQMVEGKTYKTVFPIGEGWWPDDPEVVEVNEPTGDIVKPVGKDKLVKSGLRVKKVPI